MILILFLIVSQATIFTSANKLYNEGNYREAAEEYIKLSNDIQNHQIYYNLGNCCFKLGRIGEAILYYRKANKLSPDNRDISFNLNLARSRRVDEILNIKRPKFIEVFITFSHYLSINLLLMLLSIFYSLIFIFLSISLFIKRQAFIYLNIGFLCLFVFSTGFFATNIKRFNKREGVLLDSVGEVRSGPSNEYTLTFTIHEGMEFEILEHRDEWARVILPNGLEGWIRMSGVKDI